MRLILGIIISAILLLALAFLLMRKRGTEKAYVIGEQLAKATEAEQQRKARGATGRSPMPDGEVADESAAQTLLELSKKKKPTDYCMLGVAEGKLFCLVVARSFVEGKKSFETSQSLSRFSKGIAGILSRYTGKG